MNRVYSAPKRLYYFGVRPGRTGHYLYTPEWFTPLRDGIPWSMIELDGGLCPGPRDDHRRVDAAHQHEGAAILHHRALTTIRAPWSCLAWWDRTGDPRPNSNSALVAEGTCSSCVILDAARLAFPSVMARLDAAGVHVAIDSHAQELLEAAGRIGAPT